MRSRRREIMNNYVKVKAVFFNYRRFVEGLKSLKEAHYMDYTAFGPTNLHEVEHLMPLKGSPVRFSATLGAILGLITFWLMCIFTSQIYMLITGGKPPVSNVPFIIPAYEGTILTGSVFAFIAVLIIAALGSHLPPADYDPRYSENAYGIELLCDGDRADKAVKLLEDAGASEVNQR